MLHVIESVKSEGSVQNVTMVNLYYFAHDRIACDNNVVRIYFAFTGIFFLEGTKVFFMSNDILLFFSVQMAGSDEAKEDISTRKVFLIIGPATILDNWLNEFNTWGYFSIG